MGGVGTSRHVASMTACAGVEGEGNGSEPGGGRLLGVTPPFFPTVSEEEREGGVSSLVGVDKGTEGGVDAVAAGGDTDEATGCIVDVVVVGSSTTVEAEAAAAVGTMVVAPFSSCFTSCFSPFSANWDTELSATDGVVVVAVGSACGGGVVDDGGGEDFVLVSSSSLSFFSTTAAAVTAAGTAAVVVVVSDLTTSCST